MTKRFFSLILAIVMIMALGIPSFATKSYTLTIANSSKNRTYSVYKLFDATTDGNGSVAYKLASGTNMTTSDYFTVTDAGDVYIKDAAKDGDNLTSGAVEYLKGIAEKKTAIETKPGNGKDLTFDNVNELGYYYVNSNNGTAVSIDSLIDSVIIYDKNDDNPGPAPETPTDSDSDYKPFKSVKIGENENVTDTTVQAGDTVDFTVTFEATNYYNLELGISKFASLSDIFEDKVSKDDEGNYLPIKEYRITDIPSENLTIDWSNVAVKVGTTTLTNGQYYVTDTNVLVIKWANVSGTDVTEFLYESPVTVEINYTAKMPVGDVTNSVKIDCISAEYPNKPLPVKEDPEEEPDVKLSNYDVTVQTNPSNLGEEYALKNSSGLYYKFDSNTDTVTWTNVKADATVGKEFKGLSNGTYYVEEIKAPNGYNNIESDEDVTINYDDGVVSIVYKKGIRLPSTGGVGTKVFYVFGGVLIAAAAVLLVYKKKMSAQQ